MNSVEKNYSYFKENQQKLTKKFPNQYVVIVNEKVIFNSKEKDKAIEYVKKLEAGTYILQKCDTNEKNSIQMFHTRVSFR